MARNIGEIDAVPAARFASLCDQLGLVARGASNIGGLSDTEGGRGRILSKAAGSGEGISIGDDAHHLLQRGRISHFSGRLHIKQGEHVADQGQSLANFADFGAVAVGQPLAVGHDNVEKPHLAPLHRLCLLDHFGQCSRAIFHRGAPRRLTFCIDCSVFDGWWHRLSMRFRLHLLSLQ
jgi:hypothetical protein